MSQNYVVGGIEYDWKTGLPVVPAMRGLPPNAGIKGTGAIPTAAGGGKPGQVWMGRDYGWQSPASAAKLQKQRDAYRYPARVYQDGLRVAVPIDPNGLVRDTTYGKARQYFREPGRLILGGDMVDKPSWARTIAVVGTPNDEGMVYTGSRYGWQLQETARRHRLPGGGVVGGFTDAGSAAPPSAPASRPAPTPASRVAPAALPAGRPTPRVAPQAAPPADAGRPVTGAVAAPSQLAANPEAMSAPDFSWAYQADLSPFLSQLAFSPEDIYSGSVDIELEPAVQEKVTQAFSPAAGTATAAASADPAYGTPEFEARRRAAFLDSSDSMAGIKNVRNLVGKAAGLGDDEIAKMSLRDMEAKAQNRGGSITGAAALGEFPENPEFGTDPELGVGILEGRDALKTDLVAAASGASSLASGLEFAKDEPVVTPATKVEPVAPEMLDETETVGKALQGKSALMGELANNYLQNAFRGKVDLATPADYSSQPLVMNQGDGEMSRRLAALAAAGVPYSAAQQPGAILGTQPIGWVNGAQPRTRAELGFQPPEALRAPIIAARYPRF